jgi:CRP-like cAMP-binding protein
VFTEELSRVTLFGGLDHAVLERLGWSCRSLSVPAGATVYQHGAPGDAFYVVLSGGLAAYHETVGKPSQLVARYEPNDYFGEMCLYDEVQRQTTVRAEAASRLLRVAKEDFQEVLSANPRLALRLHVAAAKRRSLEAKAALELGRRAELRIRLGMPVRLQLASGELLRPVLENLSVGGMCLAGVPDDWQPDFSMSGTLIVGKVRLEAPLRVAWRRGEAVGVAFDARAVDHDSVVYRILRELAGDETGG